jgi:SAM-dependent methyltransferase
LVALVDLLLPVIVILIVIVAVSIIWPLLMGAAWSPTSVSVVDKMLEMAKVDSNDVVYDLGSGDGRIVAEAARRYHARAVGVEVDPLRVIWSWIAIRVMGLNNRVKIVWGNIFHQDIGDATVVTLFLWQRTNRMLKKKLLEELKPGTRVVSYIWTFDGWIPIEVDKEDRVYLYIIGESDY